MVTGIVHGSVLMTFCLTLRNLVCIGISGNVLINKNADRLKGFNVWDYAEGYDSYYVSMTIDLTQPPDKVGYLSPNDLQCDFLGASVANVPGKQFGGRVH